MNDLVLNLYNEGFGSRKIAKALGVSRWRVQQIYKDLNIINPKRYKRKEIPEILTCKICKKNFNRDNFRKRVSKTGRISYEPYCLICEKEFLKENCKKRYAKSPEKWVKYRENNREKIRNNYKEYYKNPNNKIRKLFSAKIRAMLHGNKNNFSILNHLNYSIEDLKKHLESLFEPWMNWNNHGKYSKKSWDDNNPATWTWQIDHIIPASKFYYTSMNDESFKECWSLKNLRPLSSKQNLIDGVSKIRHFK